MRRYKPYFMLGMGLLFFVIALTHALLGQGSIAAVDCAAAVLFFEVAELIWKESK